MQRWIMHIDMDAFFASVEQLDDPKLRGEPVIVGGRERGVVSAASYEARKFGVHSAMPVGQARRLCPQGIFVRGRMARYQEISRRVIGVLREFSPRVEQASIDEAYLDATGLSRLFGPIADMGRRVKAAVREETGGLTCSVGIAPVKFLAKIASDMRKPDGLYMLSPEEVPAFVSRLPVGALPGVGASFGQALDRIGVHTAGDVLRYSETFWRDRHGKAGETLYLRARGIDGREVEPWTPPKSESAETTFARDTLDRTFLVDWLFRHADRVGRSLRRQHLAGRVITLKIKFADFQQITRQTHVSEPICSTQTIFEAARALLDGLRLRAPVRLIGLGVSGFAAGARQRRLPFAVTGRERLEKKRLDLDVVLDAVAGKYGESAIVRGRLCERRPKGPDDGSDGRGKGANADG
jgi:DNA polymerase-4